MALLDIQQLNALAKLADQLLLDKNRMAELDEIFKVHIQTQYTFESDFCEGFFYYILGNFSSELYRYQSKNWYSNDLINTVTLYQKAVFFLKKSSKNIKLLSDALTNLGNYLSSQGRLFCAQYYWNQAIKIDANPVAIISKAQNYLFIANNLYDRSHVDIHYFFTNKMIDQALSNIEKLECEQKIPIQEGGDLYSFKQWYTQNHSNNDFQFLSEFKQKFKTKTEERYFRWIAKHRLFINDLNNLCEEEIVFQDIVGLPSITQKIHTSLTLKEELVFHSNFDELRNEFTYARFLIFQASELKEESEHFYNKTYPHVYDTLHAVDNLKTSHMKSAFRILYSIFDKISYFLAKYLNLALEDHKISFSGIFYKSGTIHPKFKTSENHFLHALFYILKEVEFERKNNKSDIEIPRPEYFSNLEKHRLAKIRNYLEHRSFRIVDDFGYEINTKFDFYHSSKHEELLREQSEMERKNLRSTKEYDDVLEEIENKKMRGSYILEIPLSEFEESLMHLVMLVRNSLMYLSLAVEYEERNNKIEDKLAFERVVPIK